MNGHIFSHIISPTNPKQDYNRTVQELRTFSAQETSSPSLFTSLFEPDPVPPVAVEPRRPNKEELEDTLTLWTYQEDLKEYRSKRKHINDGQTKIYECILGQCTEQLKAKLQGLPEFEDRSAAKDCAWLLKHIKNIHYQFESKSDPFMAMTDAHAAVYRDFQRPTATIQQAYKSFKNRIEVIANQGGSIGKDPVLITYLLQKSGEHPDLVDCLSTNAALDATQQAVYAQFAEQAQQRYLACTFLRYISRRKYSRLIADLENQVKWGQDIMPKTLVDAYEFALNYKGGTPDSGSHQDTGLSFAQSGRTRNVPHAPVSGSPMPGTDGVTHESIRCHRCGRRGHYASACPGETQDADAVSEGVSACLVSVVNELERDHGFSFAQATNLLSECWILLDSQSTHSIFKNPSLLQNIRHCGHGGLTMHSNGGRQTTVLVGDYLPLGITVWYNPDSLANILSLSEVEARYRVTLDTSGKYKGFRVFGNGVEMDFTKRQIGLYAYDDTNIDNTKLKTPASYNFLQTVEARRSTYNPRQLAGAEQALILYRRLGYPSVTSFKKLIPTNQIINNPVTPQDVARMFFIHGESVQSIRGRETRQKPASVPPYHPKAPSFDSETYQECQPCHRHFLRTKTTLFAHH